MSNSPDDQPGTQGQGGQPQGGQPQGGQPQGGQPQGGQPQGGQPQGGQPQGGQPQGQPQGQYQGGQPPQGGYQTGPGVGDIFSIPETKNEMKIGVLLSVLLSIGFTLVAFGVSMASSGFGGGSVGGMGALGIGMAGGLIAAPIIGLLFGIRQADVLDEQPSNILYANAGATSFVGSFLLVFLSFTLSYFLAGPGVGYGTVVGRMILPFIVTAIAAAIVSAGSIWAVENIVPGPSRTQAPPQQQGQPR